ncbi:DUF4129 domain-containing protein [Halorhabdus sp. CBA1104]|uniref:DUF4129 domain-containing protein n=1 Tax=unclassified Halorhabdus TaxID=2621901 RepID=UPI0012B23297|nr:MULTISPECIES: DUF4129 domain-containing protein [unclassified Halorhabdus]QGN06158.1 DUF4129 domain-containing protein [Halorhabdus sp. CBA1104]
MRRNRQRVLVGVTVILAVLATVIVAAAVVPTQTAERQPGNGSGGVSLDQPSQEPNEFDITVDIPPLVRPIAVALLVGFTAVGLFVRIQTLTLKGVVTSLLAAGVVFAVLQLIDLSLRFPGSGRQPQNVTNGTGPGGSGSVNPVAPGVDVPIVALGGIAVVLLGAVALLVLSSGRSESTEAASVDDQASVDELDAVGSAAGRAASRLAAGVDSTNAIYRAWAEMADALAVSEPETTTPGEFAEAAIQAGMDPDDVQELTRLFEAVRYGNVPPSPDRVERAEDALRRIEAAYATPERSGQRTSPDETGPQEERR